MSGNKRSLLGGERKNPKETTVHRHSPTIFIGIGGAGAKALQHLRIFMAERYSNVSLPGVSFLSIDTDTLSQGYQVQEDIHKDIQPLIDFRDEERINVNIDDYEELVQRKGISEWWRDFDINLTTMDLEQGSGQMRAVARLALFANATKIQSAIVTAHNQIRSVDHFDTNAPVRVHVVASLAGGTGSGMLLDVMAMVQDTIDQVHLSAWLILPSVYAEVSPSVNMNANGVAALSALNHYRSHPFIAQYEEGKETRIHGLFDFCYFISRYNNHNLNMPEPKVAYQTIGEALFLHSFSGNLSTFIQSLQINYFTYLNESVQTMYTLPDGRQREASRYYTCFSSLGIATLHTNSKELLHSSVQLLAQRCIDLIHKDRDVSKEDVLSYFDLGFSDWEDHLPDDLLAQGEARCSVMHRDLKEVIDIEPNQVNFYLENNWKDMRKIVETIHDSEASLLHSKIQKSIDVLKEKIVSYSWSFSDIAFLKKLLILAEENNTTLEQCSELDEARQAYYTKKEELISIYSSRSKIEKKEQTGKQIQLRADDTASSFSIFSLISTNLQKGFQHYPPRYYKQEIDENNEITIEVIFSSQEDFHRFEADYPIFSDEDQQHFQQCSIKQNYIEETMTVTSDEITISRLDTVLSDFIHSFQHYWTLYLSEQIQNLVSQAHDQIFEEIIRQKENLNLFLETLNFDYASSKHKKYSSTVSELIPQPFSPQKVVEEYSEQNIWDFLNLFEESQPRSFISDVQTWGTELPSFLKESLLKGTMNKEPFYHRFSIENSLLNLSDMELNSIFKTLYTNGHPWICKNTTNHLHSSYEESKNLFLGFPKGTSFSTIEKIKSIVEQNCGNEYTIIYVQTEDSSEIVLYTQSYAFPVFHISELSEKDNMMQSYEEIKYYSHESTQLRIYEDAIGFLDVIPSTPSQYHHRLDVISAFIRAQILGVYQSAKHEDYDYMIFGERVFCENGIHTWEEKNEPSVIIKVLERDYETFVALEQKLEEHEKRFQKTNEKAFVQLFVLYDYWLNALYPKEHSHREQNNDERFKLIRDILEQLQNSYKEKAISVLHEKYNDSDMAQQSFKSSVQNQYGSLLDWTIPISKEKGAPTPLHKKIPSEHHMYVWSHQHIVDNHMESLVDEGWFSQRKTEYGEKIIAYPRLALRWKSITYVHVREQAQSEKKEKTAEEILAEFLAHPYEQHYVRRKGSPWEKIEESSLWDSIAPFLAEASYEQQEEIAEEEILSTNTRRKSSHQKKALFQQTPVQSEEPVERLPLRTEEKVIQFLNQVKELYQKWQFIDTESLLDILAIEVSQVIAIRIKELESIDLDDDALRDDWFYADFLPFLDKLCIVCSMMERKLADGEVSYKDTYRDFNELLYTKIYDFCKEQNWFLIENISIGSKFDPRHHEGAGSEIVDEKYINAIIHVQKLGLLSLSGVQRLRKAHVVVGR